MANLPCAIAAASWRVVEFIYVLLSDVRVLWQCSWVQEAYMFDVDVALLPVDDRAAMHP